MTFEMRPVARIRTDFPTKFGIPRQSGFSDKVKARIVFEKEFRNPEAVRGLENFSHIWLLWLFSEKAPTELNACFAQKSKVIQQKALGQSDGFYDANTKFYSSLSLLCTSCAFFTPIASLLSSAVAASSDPTPEQNGILAGADADTFSSFERKLQRV